MNREDMIQIIKETMSYRPLNEINTVYMGGMAQTQLYRIVGAKYPDSDSLSQMLETCPPAKLFEAWEYITPYKKAKERQDFIDDEQCISRLRLRGFVVNKETD